MYHNFCKFRTLTKRGRSGYPQGVKTRKRERHDLPKQREGGFYPEALEKGLRSERALLTICAEIYVKGVSTRKVSYIVERTF